MRKLLVATVKTAVTPLSYMLHEGAPKVWSRTSLGVDDIPPDPVKPFAIVTAQPSTVHQAVQDTSNAQGTPFQVYVYDTKGGYTRIDEVLEALVPVVKDLAGQRSPSGAYCIGSRWEGFSQDMFAEEYDAAMRFATFRLTST